MYRGSGNALWNGRAHWETERREEQWAGWGEQRSREEQEGSGEEEFEEQSSGEEEQEEEEQEEEEEEQEGSAEEEEKRVGEMDLGRLELENVHARNKDDGYSTVQTERNIQAIETVKYHLDGLEERLMKKLKAFSSAEQDVVKPRRISLSKPQDLDNSQLPPRHSISSITSKSTTQRKDNFMNFREKYFDSLKETKNTFEDAQNRFCRK